MKVRIGMDEAYPVYNVYQNPSDSSGIDIEVPDEKVEEWIRVIGYYGEVQLEIERALKASVSV
jgi:hypothetical protein